MIGVHQTQFFDLSQSELLHYAKEFAENMSDLTKRIQTRRSDEYYASGPEEKDIKVVVFDLEELCNPKIEDSKLWRRVTQAVQGESDVLFVVNKRALVISEKSGLWVRDV